MPFRRERPCHPEPDRGPEHSSGESERPRFDEEDASHVAVGRDQRLLCPFAGRVR